MGEKKYKQPNSTNKLVISTMIRATKPSYMVPHIGAELISRAGKICLKKWKSKDRVGVEGTNLLHAWEDSGANL